MIWYKRDILKRLVNSLERLLISRDGGKVHYFYSLMFLNKKNCKEFTIYSQKYNKRL